MLLPWVLGFRVLSLGAIAGAAAVLLYPEAVRRRLLPDLVSYATGTLLGSAFLGMIPAALGQAPARSVTHTVLAGIVLFFMLEKLVFWRHCHESDCVAHQVPQQVGDFGILLDGGCRLGGPDSGLHRQVAPAASIHQLALLRLGR